MLDTIEIKGKSPFSQTIPYILLINKLQNSAESAELAIVQASSGIGNGCSFPLHIFYSTVGFAAQNKLTLWAFGISSFEKDA